MRVFWVVLPLGLAIQQIHYSEGIVVRIVMEEGCFGVGKVFIEGKDAGISFVFGKVDEVVVLFVDNYCIEMFVDVLNGEGLLIEGDFESELDVE